MVEEDGKVKSFKRKKTFVGWTENKVLVLVNLREETHRYVDIKVFT